MAFRLAARREANWLRLESASCFQAHILALAAFAVAAVDRVRAGVDVLEAFYQLMLDSLTWVLVLNSMPVGFWYRWTHS